MSMFSLHEQPAKLLNHNPRMQRSGEDLVLAGDIRLQVVVPAKVLAAFDSQFEPLLFRKSQPGDAGLQQEVGVPSDPNISRRLPQLGSLSWNEKYPGFRLVVVKGLGLQAPMVLADRELSKFDLEALEGGLVKITFNASGPYETTSISGELDGLQQREVDITLEPPKADDVAEVSPQRELDGVPLKNVLVKGIDVGQSTSTHLFRADCVLSDGALASVGEWAYRPSLEEIAIALFEKLDAAVEFMPTARSLYEEGHAEA